MSDLDFGKYGILKGAAYRWNNFYGRMPGGYIRDAAERISLIGGEPIRQSYKNLVADVDGVLVEMFGEGAELKAYLGRFFRVTDELDMLNLEVLDNISERDSMCTDGRMGDAELDKKKLELDEAAALARAAKLPIHEELDAMLEPVIRKLLSRGYALENLL